MGGRERRRRDRRRLGWAVAVVVLVALAAPQRAESVAGGAQRWTFDPGAGADTEVSLATDPADPRRVLVAWQEDISRVWSAVTRNAGRSWTVRLLHDPVAPALTGSQEAFDPTAAIGPDGTLYVLMGGLVQPAPGASLTGGITLARSVRGDRWDFHHVDEAGTAHVWDAMHLAVAPDTGRLYVVAQSIDHRGIGFWRSNDRGGTWSSTRFPQVETPEGAAQVAQDGFEFWPRIAAGRRGLVLLVTKALLDNVTTAVSRDGGDSFEPVRPLGIPTVTGRLVGLPAAVDRTTAVVAYVTERGVVVLRSSTGGAPWRASWSARPDDAGEPDWSSVAARNGVTWVLHTDKAPGDAWRVRLTKSFGSGSSTRVLAEVAAPRPRGESAGDEYGGVALAPDGTLWAAWSEPREGRSPVIAVMRIPR